MQVADYSKPSQSEAADYLEKILSRKCKIHQKHPCEYLNLKPSEFSPRLCCECMEVRNIPFNEAISIRLLLQATANTTFQTYPKFASSSINQTIMDLKIRNDRIQTDLSSFFDKLNSVVSQAIEKTKYAQKQKLVSLSDSYQEVLNSLGQISQITQFKELVKNSNQSEVKLRAFIQSQYSKINNYTEAMNNKLQDFQKVEQSFSLSDANNRLQSIVGLIEGITLFTTFESNQQLQQQPLFQQNNQNQQPVQQHQLPIEQPHQQQEQLQQRQQKQQQQLRQQGQIQEQLREQEQQKQLREQQKKNLLVSSSLQSDYDHYRSLFDKLKNRLLLYSLSSLQQNGCIPVGV